jgi:hypothetical protein
LLWSEAFEQLVSMCRSGFEAGGCPPWRRLGGS